MTVEIFFMWLAFCFIVGIIGINRNIGYWGTFFMSLILSPIVGIIFALLSKRKEKIIVSKETRVISVADEIFKYQELKSSGAITEEEFIKIKTKLLNI